MNYVEQLKCYVPYNEQEENDKKVMLNFIDKYDDCLTRKNEVGHFTSSAWVLNKKRDKVLMVFHNIYNSWAWTGGHADGECNLLNTAIKEVKEETGIKKVDPIFDDIFSIEIICVDGHVKNGKYVSSHLHFNYTYLLEADEKEELFIKKDENSGVKWVSIDEVKDASTETWIVNNIYNKLNDKLKNINFNKKGE